MKFVDEASILVVAGDGGNGCELPPRKVYSERRRMAATAVTVVTYGWKPTRT